MAGRQIINSFSWQIADVVAGPDIITDIDETYVSPWSKYLSVDDLKAPTGESAATSSKTSSPLIKNE